MPVGRDGLVNYARERGQELSEGAAVEVWEVVSQSKNVDFEVACPSEGDMPLGTAPVSKKSADLHR